MCIKYNSYSYLSRGYHKKFSMEEIYELFRGYGQVHKIILDISLPGRAGILSCLILMCGYLMHLYLQLMDIRGALNAILRLKGLKLPGGDSRGLLIDKVCMCN